MKKGLLALGAIALCAAILSFFVNWHLSPGGLATPTLGNSNATISAAAVSSIVPGPTSTVPSATTANSTTSVPSAAAVEGTAPAQDLQPAVPHPLEYTNLAPAIVMDALSTTFRNYSSMFRGNPVGTNPEITSALNGHNPKQANFINPETGMRINEKGELVDPWGTPYFFHQLSANEMEIHSAGPDKIMWTRDDLVTK